MAQKSTHKSKNHSSFEFKQRKFKGDPQSRERRFALRLLNRVILCSVLVLLGIVSAKAVYGRLNSVDFLKIKQIRIAGCVDTDSAMVVKTAQIPLNTSVVTVKFSELKQRLYSIRSVASVSLWYLIPNTLYIKIKERKPIALISTDQIYLCDTATVVWPMDGYTSWNLPLIIGLKDTLITKTMRKLTVESERTFFTHVIPVLGMCRAQGYAISQLHYHASGQIQLRLETYPFTVTLQSPVNDRQLRNLRSIISLYENKSFPPTSIDLCAGTMAFVK